MRLSRAVVVLRLALAKGYKDCARLRQDTELKALQGREDFQRGINDLDPERTRPESGKSPE